MNVHLKLFLLILAGICIVRPAGAVTLPFVEDFELSNGGFTTASTNSWKWGVPSSPEGPGAAHSGTQVWGTNITGSYAPNLNAVLRSPAYDLSSAAGKHIVLHWWQYLVTEQGFDFAEVQVSKDGGGTWETVFGPRHGVVNDQWTQHTVLLDPSYATVGFQIRFRLITDNGVSVGGFFVDDIRISAAAFSNAVPLQNFEANDGGYVVSGTNPSWEYGAPVSAPGSAFSGQFAWATNLNGFYNANENSTLTSPMLDLSGSAGKLLAVTWAQYFDTEEGYDFVDVEVSNDNGTTWAVMSILSGKVSSSGWMRQQAFLPSGFATSTFRLRFRLRSDSSFQYDGAAIDDIALLATNDLFPAAGSFAKSAPENFSIQFTRENFASVYSDPDGGVLSAILIEQLPAAGVLKIGGAPVALNSTISASALNTLTYVPEPNTTGFWSFGYRAGNFFAPSVSALVTLNILGPTPQVVITEHPSPATVNPGSLVTFKVIAVSSLTLDYQWRKNGGNIPNATGSILTIPSVTEAHEDTYDVVVSNSQNLTTSNTAILSVNDPVMIIGQPGPSVVNEGGDINFNVTATGTGRLDYQWLKDGAPLMDQTFAALNIENAVESDSGNYHCVVTNIVGPKPTAVFSLAVRLAPRIVTNPVSIGIRRLRPATFEVVAEGYGPFTYQWLKNGFEIPGATGSVLVINKLLDANMGSYTVRVSNSVASVESDPADLQVLLWRDVHGNYQDVLERLEPLPGETPCPGRLTVTLSGWGYISGVLVYDGSVYRFRGRLDSQMVLERVFPRGRRAPLNLRIQLDALAHTIAATVSHDEMGNTVMSDALMPKHMYHRRVNPAPQQGRYTALLEPEAGVAAAPQAPGYLNGLVSSSGRARLVGRLPSGQSFSFSGFMHDTGRLPLHEILHQANGLRVGELCGRLGFDLENGTMIVDGGLVWRHQPRPRETFMPAPFVIMLEAEGSLYARPARRQPVLTLPLGVELFELEIQGPITGGNLESWLRITPFNFVRIDPATDENIKFRLYLRTGRVRGSFIDIGTGRRHYMEGVVIQARQAMGGYFRGLTEPGRFDAMPLLQ